MKSVMAGEYTAPPAHGPAIKLICGTTPLACDVAPKDFRVTAERNDAFLNARAARIVDADHRRAGSYGQIHHFADFFGIGFAERTTENGKILRKQKDLPSVDGGITGKHAVAEKLFFFETEAVGTVRHEPVELGKRPFIDKRRYPFARGTLSALVLAGDRVCAPRGFGQFSLLP